MLMTIIRRMRSVLHKLLVVVFALSCVLAVGAVAAAASGLPCSDTVVTEGEQAAKGYTYSLIRSECVNTLRVRIQANFTEARVMEAYKAHNRSLEQQVAKYAGRKFPVTITFSRPMSDADLALFIEQIDLQVDSYIMGLRDAQGGKAVLTYWPDDGRALSDALLVEKGMIDLAKHSPQGVLVVNGVLTITDQNVRAITMHEQVLLLDLTALDILPVLEQKYQTTITDIFLPSPYWDSQW